MAAKILKQVEMNICDHCTARMKKSLSTLDFFFFLAKRPLLSFAFGKDANKFSTNGHKIFFTILYMQRNLFFYNFIFTK